ncbi:MobC family plasmid mobilization relaxosome protein [Pseudonocardia sp. ICBG1293]|uniref:MobC family plasmid mobilization relaxosome protein n=1 Tax=Pseudonocardia sp. ICBG1293 TaxID=2844382 RepID=UPI001CCD44C7|nr:MobC family plasmid mobilization relaxosome protein [Pseudonocardia sp. ICBG1293]
MQALMGLRSELMEDRRVLRNVGGNLNDVARVANSDGVVDASAGRVLELVSRAVERIDATVVAVDEQVGVERAVVRSRARSRAQRDRGSGPGESGGVG